MTAADPHFDILEWRVVPDTESPHRPTLQHKTPSSEWTDTVAQLAEPGTAVHITPERLAVWSRLFDSALRAPRGAGDGEAGAPAGEAERGRAMRDRIAAAPVSTVDSEMADRMRRAARLTREGCSTPETADFYRCELGRGADAVEERSRMVFVLEELSRAASPPPAPEPK